MAFQAKHADCFRAHDSQLDGSHRAAALRIIQRITPGRTALTLKSFSKLTGLIGPRAISPDYDTDPERWLTWQPRREVHEIVARELSGPSELSVPVVGCGDRIASARPGRLVRGATRDPELRKWFG